MTDAEIKQRLKEHTEAHRKAFVAAADAGYVHPAHYYVSASTGQYALSPEEMKSWQAQLDAEIAYVKGTRTLATDPVAECNHEWRHYVGFTEVYDYCVKCDKKLEANR